MNLIDENYNRGMVGNKKLIIFIGTIIIILIFAIIVLLAIVTSFKTTSTTLSIDKYTYKNYSKVLKEINGELYIGIEDLSKLLSSGYSYKRGSIDGIDENKCYISNLYESVYFEAGSKHVRKVITDSDISYIELDSEVVKDNNQMYLALNDVNAAVDVLYNKTDTNISLKSIAYLESYYTSASMKQDKSIVWDTTYNNKKMLKKGLVIIKDSTGKLGIATISTVLTDKKTKTYTVLTNPIIDAKFNSISYIEKYDMLVVGTSTGKGLIYLAEQNGKYIVEQKVGTQYDNIYPINETLYKVGKKDETTMKYGVIDEVGNVVIPIQYDQIGIDLSKYDDFNLRSGLLLYDSLIPVKKGDLYGLMDVKGNAVTQLEYTGFGCTQNNIGSNVLIIPDLNGIVYVKNGKYGIVGKNGKLISNPEITKIYKEVKDDKVEYNMIYNNTKHNIVTYFGGTASNSNVVSVKKKESN